MHEIDPVIILLMVFLVGFACVTTGLALSGVTIYWGNRLGASKVPMSRRSRTLFMLTAWMFPLFVITGTLQYRIAGVFGLGLFVGFLGTMISAIIDNYRFRRSPARPREDDSPADGANSS